MPSSEDWSVEALPSAKPTHAPSPRSASKEALEKELGRNKIGSRAVLQADSGKPKRRTRELPQETKAEIGGPEAIEKAQAPRVRPQQGPPEIANTASLAEPGAESGGRGENLLEKHKGPALG